MKKGYQLGGERLIMRDKLDIELHDLKGGTKKQRKYYMEAIEVAKVVVNSQAFKDKIKSFKYTYRDVINDTFKHNKGLTNSEVYTLFMSGYDKYSHARDNDIDLSVTLYYKRFSSAVGYTYGDTLKTWINTRFFTGTSRERIVSGIVGNIIHESVHNVGFDHAFRKNPTRKFSVPYALGDIARELALDYLEPDSEEMVKTCYRTWYGRVKCKWVRA